MVAEVVIIGGGYAGVMAANRMAATKSQPVRVTIINSRAAFVERIRLHEHAAGSSNRDGIPFSTLLNPAVNVVIADASVIDPSGRTVSLSNGATLPYDYLVYAAGSAERSATPGRFSVANIDDASALQARLAELPEHAVVEIVGGGLTGIETASEIAERYPSLSVRLRTSGVVGPSLGERGSRRVRASLERLGVEVLEKSSTPADSDASTHTIVSCTGFSVPTLAADSGLEVDDSGRLLVDANLNAIGHDRIFGAGDAAKIADPDFDFHRMSCASALPMGAHVADNILRVAGGEGLKPHSAGYVAQCISLGRRDGLVQWVQRDDVPRRSSIHGRFGAIVKEMICTQTVKWMSGESRRSGAYSWFAGPGTALASRSTTTERESVR